MINYELDKKILILYILSKLPSKVDFDSLYEIVNDNNIGYFDYTQCLNDLVDNGNIIKDDNGIEITDKGRINAESVKNEISNSVKVKTNSLLHDLIKKVTRDQHVKSEIFTVDGNTFVKLNMNDGISDLIDLKILAPNEDYAKKINKNFLNSAENIYKNILEMLS